MLTVLIRYVRLSLHAANAFNGNNKKMIQFHKNIWDARKAYFDGVIFVETYISRI